MCLKHGQDGTFEAPTNDCQRGQCKWSANKGKAKGVIEAVTGPKLSYPPQIFVLWGQAGLHELEIAEALSFAGSAHVRGGDTISLPRVRLRSARCQQSRINRKCKGCR